MSAAVGGVLGPGPNIRRTQGELRHETHVAGGAVSLKLGADLPKSLRKQAQTALGCQSIDLDIGAHVIMRLSALAVTMLIALGLPFSPALADCATPKEPAKIPDAVSATEADMVSAQQAVKQYLAAMEERLKCLGDTSPNYNSSVDQMQKIAMQFNATVRAYRSKHT